MKGNLYIIILFFLYATTTYCQQAPLLPGTVKGLVVDSLKGNILYSATVRLLLNDSTVANSLTNDQGSFQFRDVIPGNYTILVSHTGYFKKDIQFSLLGLASKHVGTIALAPGDDQLEEIKIVSKKILVEHDVDKLTYNVDADPESKTLNMFDLLRKVPSVSIDGDDNIQVNGNSSYLVLMNGKKTMLFAQNPSDVFKTIQASTVLKIEVIASPSSRYEAEGIGGIINIITYKKVLGGYNGSVGATTFRKSFSTNASLTAKVNKVGISIFYGKSITSNPAGTNSLFRDNIKLDNRLMQSGSNKSNNRFFYLGSEMSYEFDSVNLLNISYNTNKGTGSNYFRQDVSLVGYMGNVLDAYNIVNFSFNKMAGKEVGIDYQRAMKNNKEKLVTLSYKLNNNENNYNSFFYRDLTMSGEKQEENTNNDTRSNEHTLQADFIDGSHAFTPEIGVKTIIRVNSTAYLYKHILNTGGILIDPQSNNFKYNQNVHAAYGSLSYRKGNWGFKAGSRIEASTMKAEFLPSGNMVKQFYFNVIPSISASHKLTMSSSIRFNFTQRVERPSLYYIDPYVDFSDAKNISFGNPELKPALSNIFNVAYSSFKKGISFNGNFFYNFTYKSIERFTTLDADTISRTTYGNIGRSRRIGVALNANSTIFERMNINMNLGTFYATYGREKLVYNNGFTYNIFMFGSYRFKNGLRVGANVGYNSGNILVQAKSSGYLTNSFSLNKDILKKKKTTVSFAAANPFQKFKKVSTVFNEPSFYQLQRSNTIVRRFSISLSYRFGGLQEDIIHKKRGIRNDDLKVEQKDSQ